MHKHFHNVKATTISAAIILTTIIIFTCIQFTRLWKSEGNEACSGSKSDFLDKNCFTYNEAKSAIDWFSARSINGLPIPHLSLEDAVRCLDNNFRSSSTNPEKPLKIVFMGDSRMRQHFHNFAKLIPDYDRVIYSTDPKANLTRSKFHDARNYTSPLLNVVISMRVRTVLGAEMTKDTEFWIAHPPDILIIGIQVHHMLPENESDHVRYLEQLRRLAPLLRQLSSSTRLIWLNQYPTFDMIFAPEEYQSSHVSQEKIYRYNQAARRILEENGVRIWDSANPFVEEYVRSCSLLSRSDPVLFFEGNGYFDCEDFVHSGYVALQQATQLLLNHICSS